MKKDKPLSYYTNRLSILMVLIFFSYNVYHSFINNAFLPEWMVVTIVTSLAITIGSPNKSFELGDNKRRDIDTDE